MSLSDLKQDCRHVRWDRPCQPHKLRGKTCATCDEYSPVRSRILMVKLEATGDVLRTTSFLPAIHAMWPGAKVTWVTRPESAGLFVGNPLVDEVWLTDDLCTAARLSSERFDVVLCPDADPDAAAIAALAQGKARRGFLRDAVGRVVPLSSAAARWMEMGLCDAKKKANRATYQQLVGELLGLDPTRIGLPILEPSTADRAFATQFLAPLQDGRPLVGINTGSGERWLYKQWTFAHQLRFLQLAHARGWRVLLLGGSSEVVRHAELLAAAPGLAVTDAGNRHSLTRFGALVERCATVVTGDTLAMHVAVARRVPVVALFGPTSLHEIELFGRGSKLAPQGLDCLCCYLPRCDRTPHCQALIEPETVAQEVAHWLVAGQNS